MNRSKRICLGAAQSGGGPPPFARFQLNAPRRHYPTLPLHVLAVLLAPPTCGLLLPLSQPADALSQQAARQVFLPPDLGAAVGSDEAALLLPGRRLTRSRNCQTP